MSKDHLSLKTQSCGRNNHKKIIKLMITSLESLGNTIKEKKTKL